MYVVENDFKYKGYRCVVIFTDRGWRCGYVGVPLGHMLYKKEFTDYLDIPKSELDNEEIGDRGILPIFFSAIDDDDRVRLDTWFNVHGGITYSRDGDYPVKSDLWWLGFDCGHYRDGKDLELVKKYWGDNPRIQKKLEIEEEFFDDHYPVRSTVYVESQCMSLVNQIIALEYRERVVQNEEITAKDYIL